MPLADKTADIGFRQFVHFLPCLTAVPSAHHRVMRQSNHIPFAAVRRHLPSFHDCTPNDGDTGTQLPIPVTRGGKVEIVVGHADGRPGDVVVGLNEDIDAPAITLNGAKPCGPAVRENGLSGPWWRPKAAWRIPFAAGAAADGRNIVSISPARKPARVMWCEIEVKNK